MEGLNGVRSYLQLMIPRASDQPPSILPVGSMYHLVLVSTNCILASGFGDCGSFRATYVAPTIFLCNSIWI